MSLEIRHLEASEIPQHVLVVRTSLYTSNDANNLIIYPHGPTPALLAWQQARFAKVFADTAGPDNIFLGAFPAATDKATAGSTPPPAATGASDMLSTALWKVESPATYNAALDSWTPCIPDAAAVAPTPDLPPTSPHLPMDEARPPDSNPAAINYFMKRIDAARQRAMGRDETYYHLSLLATMPGCERRGAGRALLEWGLERADCEGRRAYLDATEIGRPFYERFGFYVVDVVRLRAEDWGDASGRVGETYAMVREAGGRPPAPA